MTSDHGESLWDDEPFFEHGTCVMDSTVRILGIVHLPKAVRAGTRVKEPLSGVDWMPSVLKYLNIVLPDSMEGVPRRLSGSSSSTRAPHPLLRSHQAL